MKRVFPVVDMKKTGLNIKRIMQEKGFTVRDIQQFLELETPQSIYHWFAGISMPTLDHLYALSELLRMPVDALLIGNRKYVQSVIWNPACLRLYAYFGGMQEMRSCAPDIFGRETGAE